MTLAERIGEFLQRLTPMTRGNLLTELERLESSDDEIPGAAEVVAKLRAELRKDGSSQNRAAVPSRYFFAPLEPLLTDTASDNANAGRIQRASLSAIWEWISRDLLPTMARDYIKKLDDLNSADNPKEARKETSIFQTKVVKYLESTLSAQDRAEQTRAKLAVYTASRAVYDDLIKIMCALQARDALAKFNDALPPAIPKFDEARIARILPLLDAFGKAHPTALPFALALVAKRLKTSWQLILLATRAAPNKSVAAIAATPYAVVVPMVMDRLDDKRLALRAALRKNRVLVAKEILSDIYDTESALRDRIDLGQSEWGARLSKLMDAIGALVQAEVARFPDKLGHVLGSRSLRGRRSLSGRLSQIVNKGRDAVSGGASHLKKLIGQPEKSRA